MKSIAIVYSEDHVRDHLDKILTNEGFQVFPYYDPHDLIEHCHLIEPSLYLINFKNVNIDGFELYKKLVEKKGKNKVKVVFISSHHEIEEEAYNLGGLDFIKVPFENNDLIKRIISLA
tara:strand:+ start:327 stop:680 length:354 start_codon:yes stop_codon:yes gene_type:complete